MVWSWVYLLFTLALVFAAGARLPGARNPWTSGLGAAFLFLVNPVVIPSIFSSPTWYGNATLLFAILIVAAWLWMQNWSGFMRTLVLVFLFSGGLLLGARSVFWVALAMVPWVLYNRRPWLACASLASSVVGGYILFALTEGIVGILLHQPHGLWTPWVETIIWLQSVWPALAEFSQQNGPEISHRLAGNLDRVTLGWSLLVLAIAGQRLQGMIRQRRSDVLSFIAALAVLAFAASLRGSVLDGLHESWAALATLVAVTAPLVASEFSAREFLYNRSARIAAGIGIVTGALAMTLIGWTLFGSVVGILVAGVLSLALPPTRKLVHRVRWRAVFLGCSVGASLTAGFAALSLVLKPLI